MQTQDTIESGFNHWNKNPAACVTETVLKKLMCE